MGRRKSRGGAILSQKRRGLDLGAIAENVAFGA